uniref:SET domain-containing protein n=1 Tax=Hyaloperonospora arabidopsidis (strain Emoy2) TaxID=559515 RepID=M4C385_HYAAE
MDDNELYVPRSYYYLLHAASIQEDHGLEVRESNIPRAGKGLFATKRHLKGSVICEYTGVVLHSQEAAWKLKDKSYLMKLGDGKYVDTLHCPHVLARYINDCRGRFGGFNVHFDKRPDDNKANVVAMRDIEPGEELYVNYGRLYWLAYNMMHPSNPVR